MAVNNALNITAQGTVYFNGTGTFSEIDASTAGFVYTSNGTGVAPSFQTLPILSTAVITLTSAEIKALHATPKTLVAAQGLGTVIVPIEIILGKFKYGGTNVFVAGAAQAVNIYYGIVQQFNVGSAFISNTALVAAASSYGSGQSTGFSNIATSSLENVALTAWNSVATEISGNAANDNTITIIVKYYVVTL